MSYTVERLNEDHIYDWFDCGHGNALGNWLIKWGRKYEERHQSAIWVMCEQGSTEVLGYFCLSSQVIDSKALPRVMREGISTAASHPGQLLGKFAVAQSLHGTSASYILMHEVFKVYRDIAGMTGTRFLILQAPEEKVRSFYESFDFVLIDSDRGDMVISTQAVLNSLRES
ncbi:hypothetical protein [Varibaculum prostatecancerukia]|uniref:hypothetical protein n=1 Tax=Varibaculum prostatecancerukia TaxID=2811781 RepID=UPI001C004926|nr:hypothetical protein [Varibaculum prostatecancerukia]